MSLPPGFLDELRDRVSLARVVSRKVTWDARKTNAAKGDFWAPCPFHQEKTASFHVDDRKGFYYCFGCHAKGDAISFMRDAENMGFMEAVEVLASDAGMTLPARDPVEAQRAEKRAGLVEAMEEAARFFRRALQGASGARARDYLDSRALSATTQERFGIGFAPDARTALTDHLTAKGFSLETVVEAGLAARPEGGGAPFDRFRGRVIFPIRDARGRCIAFGGRALDPGAPAKYLNSPETPLFDKGRTLFNVGPARAAAGKAGRLIVAEGYMDVIALVQAGFEAAVAPLGTAITETQLEMLWRLAEEPVVALDGDRAGLQAAQRLIDLALPLLGPGRSLRFCLMPEGADPDDVLRSGGPAAMQSLVEGAVPIVQLLWQRETEGQSFDSPERRSGLDARLRAHLKRIADTGLREHYRAAIRDLRAELFAPARRSTRDEGKRTGQMKRAAAGLPSAEVRRLVPLLPAETQMREHLVLAVCCVTPSVIGEFASDIAALEITTPRLEPLRAAILACAEQPDRLAEEITPEDRAMLLSQPLVRLAAAIRNPGDIGIARKDLAQELAKLSSSRAAAEELAEALEELGDLPGEHLVHRIREAAQRRNQSRRGGFEEDQEEFVRAPNGAMVSQSDRARFQAIFETIRSGRDRPPDDDTNRP